MIYIYDLDWEPGNSRICKNSENPIWAGLDN